MFCYFSGYICGVIRIDHYLSNSAPAYRIMIISFSSFIFPCLNPLNPCPFPKFASISTILNSILNYPSYWLRSQSTLPTVLTFSPLLSSVTWYFSRIRLGSLQPLLARGRIISVAYVCCFRSSLSLMVEFLILSIHAWRFTFVERLFSSADILDSCLFP